MDLLFIVRTLARRGLLKPGSPNRVADQLNALRRWGFTLAGELRAAEARDPHRIAVIDEHRGPITYRQLMRRAQRLATALGATRGVGPGVRVGLMCRNHAGLVEAMVACSLLGADAVLVNTALSAPQLAAVAEQQQLRLLLHDREFAPTAAAAACERLDESVVEALIAETSSQQRWDDVNRAGRTIVLTSGTTGAPKGARRPTPKGFGPLVSIIDRIPLHVGERILISAPLFHTWGYAALQLALAMRATVVLQRRFEPTATVQAVDAHGCTALFAVPVMLQRLVEAGAVPARPPRITAVSGSALPGGLATLFMNAWGDCLYNLYGSTEASWASIATPADLRRDHRTAGRPPHGTRIAILDPTGRPVARGEIGEIHVGNEMLFEGYTRGPGDPAAADLRGGLLGTGDLGHLDADGLLHVDGRADDMVVSGGENVFPRPLEELLAQLPQVREVAVVGVPDAQYGQRLAAYLVLHPGQTLDADEVREYVRHYLARFSVPRDVHFLPELPRTATGKVIPRLLHPM
ncbi:fatty-acyl-CoA synthase [Catellatospora sp. IY07-71]|uniref:AMP-binding protein n=1 Tax=Catellatospora sp. IY07-71 TaxID=2728827 RepID=UPI001BB3557B|nr:AMP-binding protein [Catellatospora sp. IY07-71]BCJ71895.1 fatty-acyl-CoA synthase [Catellatospora sp. IY07-71]